MSGNVIEAIDNLTLAVESLQTALAPVDNSKLQAIADAMGYILFGSWLSTETSNSLVPVTDNSFKLHSVRLVVEH